MARKKPKHWGASRKPRKKNRLSLNALLRSIIVSGPDGSPNTWKCGNHNPAHVAISVDELVKLTKKYGCENWQAVN